jgi:hypothetical protein
MTRGLMDLPVRDTTLIIDTHSRNSSDSTYKRFLLDSPSTHDFTHTPTAMISHMLQG